MINENGEIIGNNAFAISIAAESKVAPAERNLPLYICEIDGTKKYIIPLYGAGLWGPIWGYLSLNEDGSTIYGAYFDHQGETPGLGAEITKEAFSDSSPANLFSKTESFSRFP